MTKRKNVNYAAPTLKVEEFVVEVGMAASIFNFDVIDDYDPTSGNNEWI